MAEPQATPVTVFDGDKWRRIDPQLLDTEEYVETASVRAVKMPQPFIVGTLEGRQKGGPGDYLVGPGAQGEFWPVRASIFEATHVRVERE